MKMVIKQFDKISVTYYLTSTQPPYRRRIFHLDKRDIPADLLIFFSGVVKDSVFVFPITGLYVERVKE